ncbi:Xaa-Pro aminopeptidase [Natronospirillum operosum]|uniref:Xaa-Pro aminopeptidase n=1 Tax=Natronospirillum operosum TaxID=2759953 RepID=A0A4Z0WFF1_9GAMM|nr:Xaa-Pro aminopeptidase [Natronospirillum operosum]TGG93220.1 Xaa-Pro aminopeptidase [Natronospirillum operosum]
MPDSSAGVILPAISLEEFAQRRKRLLAQLEPDSVVVLPGATEQRRNNDVDFPFRQHSDLLYLTGFTEPDAWLVLVPERAAGEAIMFCRPRDRALEIWNGYRLGPEGVVSELGIDEAHPIEDLDDRLPELLANKTHVYSPLGQDETVDAHLMHWVNQVRAQARKGVQAPAHFHDLLAPLHELRLIKSEQEVAVMRAAGEISAAAHQRAWAACVRGDQRATTEYQLEAEIRHACAWAGAPEFAYPAIVGSGANACVLHYTENTDVLRDGELVLIDAGCELHGYASDITRTFPVNGRFSPEQRALYELVLKAQKAALAEVKPGVPMRQPHEAVVRVLVSGLVELGLLEGDVDQLIEDEGYRDFFMHGTSHWLGLDVHDVGPYKINGDWRPLRPGMCLTIEPGLYVAPDNDRVEARWRGIGVRIEDDVVVTAEGHDNLTASVPVDPDVIEQWMILQR